MKVTFNEFVDNGLYVAEYYLKKKFEDISIRDLENNIDLFANHVHDFISCNKYKKIADMAFHNSSYTQVINKELKDKYKENARLESIKAQFRLIFYNLGDQEVCSICGEKHVKLIGVDEKYLSAVTRSLMPNLTANTFFNHTNNLKFLDVCPICLFLSMISVLNMRKSGNLVLFNSEDADFMKELTANRQAQNERDIFNESLEENKGNTVTVQDQIRFFISEKEWTDKSITIYEINNSGQSQTYQDYILTESNIRVFKKVCSEGFLNEFNRLNLFKLLIRDTLKYDYLKYLADFRNEKLKCEIDFFEFIDKEVSVLKQDLRDTIKNFCEKIYKVSKKNDINELKSVIDLRAFEELILKYIELYKDVKSEDLITEDEFEMFMDYRNWIHIKNRMIFNFIALKEKI